MTGISRLQVAYQLLILAHPSPIRQTPSWELHWIDATWHHGKWPTCPLCKVNDWFCSLQTTVKGSRCRACRAAAVQPQLQCLSEAMHWLQGKQYEAEILAAWLTVHQPKRHADVTVACHRCCASWNRSNTATPDSIQFLGPVLNINTCLQGTGSSPGQDESLQSRSNLV